MNRQQLTFFIKEQAQELGFFHCGIAKAAFLEEEAPRLEKWLKEGQHGSMSYMANHFDKRLDPRLLVEGGKSVISLLLNYFPAQIQRQDAPQVSKYAYGKDYHSVIKQKLFHLMNLIREKAGDVQGRAFVDSAPVMDKAWAQRAGLGWVGKNSNLISKRAGSFFFIAELIIDLDLEYDKPVSDHCGSCTRCIDACPTGAIETPYQVNGSKCISYFTIELKEHIPSEVSGAFGNWMFGCDICQDVCPWNSFSKPHREPLFEPVKEVLNMSWNEWEDITEEVFKEIFKDSPLKRSKYTGIKRNLEFLKRQ